MKVFAVAYPDAWSDARVLGVFSTLEKAEDAARDEEGNIPLDYEILEVTLDEVYD